jgi:hypothetical protein
MASGQAAMPKLNYIAAFVIVLLSSCTTVHDDMVWSYGQFCGKNYPKVPGFTSQERIVQLQEIHPKDDIDAACQQHDICYERHGRNHCLCDQLLINRLIKMDFSGEIKAKCENVRGQALYYFLSFHPSACGSEIWKARTMALPYIGVALPLALYMGLNGQPNTDQRCVSTTSSGNEIDHMTSQDVPPDQKQAEITITGMPKARILSIFANNMSKMGYILKQSDEDRFVFGLLMTKGKFGPTEPNKDYPELRVTFLFENVFGVIHIVGTNMSIALNQDSAFEGILDMDVTDSEVIESLQKLLDVQVVKMTE